LFDLNGANAETVAVTLQSGETPATAWPYRLATAVNAQAGLAKIGVLQTDGTLAPTKSATDNTVYVNSSAKYTFAIDVAKPAGGGNAQFNYPDGLGSYQPGTVVKGTDGNLYQCRRYPNSGWCNQAPAYYAPGTGYAWADAWTRTS
jgi:chitin-binding protein